MKHSDSISKIAAALVAVQSELKAVAKDSRNPHFKSSYCSLDAIIEATRPALSKHGLAVVQGVTTPHSDSEGHLNGFTVETMLVHQSGEWIVNGALMPLSKLDPQGAGGAITYGRRYGLSALLALATEEDDDGNGASHRTAPRAEGEQRRPPSQGATNPSSTSASPSPTPTAKVECPMCGGPTWDNRADKRNPKAPDFKCKDSACKGVIWPPKDGMPARNERPPLVPAGPDDDVMERLTYDDDLDDGSLPF